MTVRLLAGQNSSGGWIYDCPAADDSEVRRLSAPSQPTPPSRTRGRTASRAGRPSSTSKELPGSVRPHHSNVAGGGLDGAGRQLQHPIRHAGPVGGPPPRRAGRQGAGPRSTRYLGHAERRRRLVVHARRAGCQGRAPGADGRLHGDDDLRGPARPDRRPRDRRGDRGRRTARPCPTWTPTRSSRRPCQALGTAIGNPIGRGTTKRRVGSDRGRQVVLLLLVAGARGRDPRPRHHRRQGLVRLGFAEILLANQAADGSWHGEYPATVDTCFALLFLKRANLAADLTADLKGKLRGRRSRSRRAASAATL